MYLDVEKPFFRIERTWCSKGFRFYPPKTAAGRRTVLISAWLADVLRAHRARSGGVGLVFSSQAGTPLNKANVRKRVWIPLLRRAKVRYRDRNSLRWTFVSLARASGEVPFNVSRVTLGTHIARSSIRSMPTRSRSPDAERARAVQGNRGIESAVAD